MQLHVISIVVKANSINKIKITDNMIVSVTDIISIIIRYININIHKIFQ